jgi:mono/diheme cytochrome c family protein
VHLKELNMTDAYTNRHVVVTGGAGALGKAVVVALSIVPLILPFGVQAQKSQGKGKPGPAGGSSKAIVKTGRTLFVKNCSPCHGSTGQGGEGPNLQKMKLTDSTIGATIKNGIKEEMPAFGKKLKGADVKALTVFVHSIEK